MSAPLPALAPIPVVTACGVEDEEEEAEAEAEAEDVAVGETAGEDDEWPTVEPETTALRSLDNNDDGWDDEAAEL